MDTHNSSSLLTWNWKLRAVKEMEMSVKKDKQRWITARDDQTVRCECSCDQEEQLMVLHSPATARICHANKVTQLQCICCQKLQHYHCYGFALETDVHEHHCYQCLLEDTHDAVLGDMKSIAIFRRALWILYEKDPSSPAEFAQKLR